LPNFAKYTYGLLPLEHYHKIEKRKTPPRHGFFSLFFQFFDIEDFLVKTSRIYTAKEHFPENSQKIFSPKKDKICQCEGTYYWTISTHTHLLGFSWCLLHPTESVNYSRITTHALGKADCTPCETRV